MTRKQQARLEVLEKIANVATIWSDYSQNGYLPGHHPLPSEGFGNALSEDQIVSHMHGLLSQLDRIDAWSDEP